MHQFADTALTSADSSRVKVFIMNSCLLKFCSFKTTTTKNPGLIVVLRAMQLLIYLTGFVYNGAKPCLLFVAKHTQCNNYLRMYRRTLVI